MQIKNKEEILRAVKNRAIKTIHLSSVEIRKHLGVLVDAVNFGDKNVIIQKHGNPCAVL